jgi:glyoxylase-like metal-dependent hydrolase (beta-lactamase superfamily II)
MSVARPSLTGMLVLLLTAATGLHRPARAQGSRLHLDVYTADSNGFAVTSTLIYGKTEGILVDAQFRKSDAAKLADRIAATGTHLKAIILTHAHPDHYFGTAVLVQRFPGTPIYISAAGLEEFARTVGPKIAQWTPVYGAEIPTQVPTPAVLPAAKFTVDGEEIDVVNDLQGDAATRSNSYVWIPSLSTVIAGDIVYNQVHVWLAESNAETRRAWLASLQQLDVRHARTVVAGHKKSPALADSPAAIGFTSRYIADFDKAKAAAHTADELAAAMKQAYPDAGLLVALTFAAKAAFAN